MSTRKKGASRCSPGLLLQPFPRRRRLPRCPSRPSPGASDRGRAHSASQGKAANRTAPIQPSTCSHAQPQAGAELREQPRGPPHQPGRSRHVSAKRRGAYEPQFPPCRCCALGAGASKNGHGNGHREHNGAHPGKSSSGSRFRSNGSNVRAARTASSAQGLRKAKPSAARSLRNGHIAAGKGDLEIRLAEGRCFPQGYAF